MYNIQRVFAFGERAVDPAQWSGCKDNPPCHVHFLALPLMWCAMYVPHNERATYVYGYVHTYVRLVVVCTATPAIRQGVEGVRCFKVAGARAVFKNKASRSGRRRQGALGQRNARRVVVADLPWPCRWKKQRSRLSTSPRPSLELILLTSPPGSLVPFQQCLELLQQSFPGYAEIGGEWGRHYRTAVRLHGSSVDHLRHL
jgi:hypothetical protein